MNLYPLLMTPHFISGEKTPWSGYALRDIFMKETPDTHTGASLEVSTLPQQESLVGNGIHAGKTLNRVAELLGEALTGTDAPFPLLLKLLDAQSNVSVQVNPPEKNEAWVILNAEPGAKIVYGIEGSAEDLQKAIDENRVEELLHWVSVQPGDVYYVPAGFVHALGAGIQCYEIQDASEAAFRLYDWNRVDAEGHARQLHISEGMACLDDKRALEKNEGTTVLCRGGSRTYYISDTHFELCRLNLSGVMPLEAGRMLILTPLGECEIRWGEESMAVNPFGTVIIPAALQDVSIAGNTKVLVSSLPNREKLREELNYRAENVAGLVD